MTWRSASRGGRTAVWLGDSAVRLHALASLITQAQQILPEAVHDARDQELTWTQIGELLGTTAATTAPLPEQTVINLTRITGIMLGSGRSGLAAERVKAPPGTSRKAVAAGRSFS